MSRLENLAFGTLLFVTATPAFAGAPVPAPVAGVGIGAVLLLGIGYRVLKRRYDR